MQRPQEARHLAVAEAMLQRHADEDEEQQGRALCDRCDTQQTGDLSVGLVFGHVDSYLMTAMETMAAVSIRPASCSARMRIAETVSRRREATVAAMAP